MNVDETRAIAAIRDGHVQLAEAYSQYLTLHQPSEPTQPKTVTPTGSSDDHLPTFSNIERALRHVMEHIRIKGTARGIRIERRGWLPWDVWDEVSAIVLQFEGIYLTAEKAWTIPGIDRTGEERNDEHAQDQSLRR
jgi:hypothetical protein